jgi:TnpA family transposase
LAAKVVSGTPRDSLHVIDLIYRQDGGRRPEVIITDTGSYSDIVFGLLRLLGFDHRPQLAALPDAKLWRIDADADYGPLTTAARGKNRPRPDRPTLARHSARLVASIHTGAVKRPRRHPHAVLGRPTDPTRRRRRPLRRISKTLHVLACVDDEAGDRSKACATSKKAATTWPATSSTAEKPSSPRHITRVWRTNPAPSVWC